jgi:hypothetical protein
MRICRREAVLLAANSVFIESSTRKEPIQMSNLSTAPRKREIPPLRSDPKDESHQTLPVQATHLDRCSESNLRASETRIVAFLQRSSRISHAISGFLILASDCANPLTALERSSLSCLPVGHNMFLSLSRATQTFAPIQRSSGQI